MYTFPRNIHIRNFVRGDHFEYNYLVSENFDLTGCTGRAQLRQTPDSRRIAMTLDVEIDGQNVMLTADKERTQKLKPGSYYYDVEATTSEDKPYTIFAGTVNVLADTTRQWQS